MTVKKLGCLSKHKVASLSTTNLKFYKDRKLILRNQQLDLGSCLPIGSTFGFLEIAYRLFLLQQNGCLEDLHLRLFGQAKEKMEINLQSFLLKQSLLKQEDHRFTDLLYCAPSHWNLQYSCLKEIKEKFQETNWFIVGDLSKLKEFCLKIDHAQSSSKKTICELEKLDKFVVHLKEIILKALQSKNFLFFYIQSKVHYISQLDSLLFFYSYRKEDCLQRRPNKVAKRTLLRCVVPFNRERKSGFNLFDFSIKSRSHLAVQSRKATIASYLNSFCTKQKKISNYEKKSFLYDKLLLKRLIGEAILKYVRYSNYFLIGINGSKPLACKVCRLLKCFIEKNFQLKINKEAILLFKGGKDRVPFLGYLIEKQSLNYSLFAKVAKATWLSFRQPPSALKNFTLSIKNKLEDEEQKAGKDFEHNQGPRTKADRLFLKGSKIWLSYRKTESSAEDLDNRRYGSRIKEPRLFQQGRKTCIIEDSRRLSFSYTPQSNIRLTVNMSKVIESLSDKGFCDRLGNPKPNFYYFQYSQNKTISRVSSLLRGLTNYYQLAESRRRCVSRWSYIVTHSIAMMFAAKFKLGTRAKVFALAGRNLIKPLLSKKRERKS